MPLPDNVIQHRLRRHRRADPRLVGWRPIRMTGTTLEGFGEFEGPAQP